MKTLTFMRKRLLNFQEETGDIYNLEATPAEGTSYRLARIDKRNDTQTSYSLTNNKSDSNDAEPFYTNSSQLPVDFEATSSTL